MTWNSHGIWCQIEPLIGDLKWHAFSIKIRFTFLQGLHNNFSIDLSYPEVWWIHWRLSYWVPDSHQRESKRKRHMSDNLQWQLMMGTKSQARTASSSSSDSFPKNPAFPYLTYSKVRMEMKRVWQVTKIWFILNPIFLQIGISPLSIWPPSPPNMTGLNLTGIHINFEYREKNARVHLKSLFVNIPLFSKTSDARKFSINLDKNCWISLKIPTNVTQNFMDREQTTKNNKRKWMGRQNEK